MRLDVPLATLDRDTPDWNAFLDDTLRAFDCTTGTLHVLHEDDGQLHLVAQRGIPDDLLPKMSRIPIGKGMAGIAAERREPVQVCNLQTDGSGVARPAARETHVEGSLAAPLLHDGRLYGTIGVAKPEEYEFSDEEVSDLLRLGDAVALRLSREPETP